MRLGSTQSGSSSRTWPCSPSFSPASSSATRLGFGAASLGSRFGSLRDVLPLDRAGDHLSGRLARISVADPRRHRGEVLRVRTARPRRRADRSSARTTVACCSESSSPGASSRRSSGSLQFFGVDIFDARARPAGRQLVVPRLSHFGALSAAALAVALGDRARRALGLKRRSAGSALASGGLGVILSAPLAAVIGLGLAAAALVLYRRLAAVSCSRRATRGDRRVLGVTAAGARRVRGDHRRLPAACRHRNGAARPARTSSPTRTTRCSPTSVGTSSSTIHSSARLAGVRGPESLHALVPGGATKVSRRRAAGLSHPRARVAAYRTCTSRPPPTSA